MYQVEGLKQLAAKCIGSSIDNVFYSLNLSTVLDNIHKYTPEHCRQLRYLLVKTAPTEIEIENLLGSPTFREALNENGIFAADIVLAMHKTLNTQAEVKCRICSSKRALEEERAVKGI